ncbi:MAG TPA: succinate dehydrogenase/fumarate reductase iron-sulfur subunit [Bacteriovoracaceae bacterium]|nr:succinate dehydrogenase/fumarate reductase iron-sulfur subunit [Bacteriovoracaceae bacterium]
MSSENMSLNLKIWRQKIGEAEGRLVDYKVDQVSPDMSFLEMVDVLNEELVKKGEDTIAFDHDCREGICGSCAMMIDGKAHGGFKNTTTCQVHMRHYKNGDTIVIEPFRAAAFPIIKDLITDRTAFDKIIMAGGYVSANTGNAQDGNAVLIPKPVADEAMDAAACISCGACVASCPNGSAMLFMGAKVSQLALLPQGKPESAKRSLHMVHTHDQLGFGNCTTHAECEATCPKGISIEHIARMNREYLKAAFTYYEKDRSDGGA